MTDPKKDPPQNRGRRIDAWVGDKPPTSFAAWLRAFKKRYAVDPSDFSEQTDPAAGRRFERLTARDRVRFQPFFRELAWLGYDLRTFEGIDKFWALGQAERDRLFYIVQDPKRFRSKVREDYFGGFKKYFKDFQDRFTEFFEHFQEAEPSAAPADLAAHQRFMGLSPQASERQIKERYHLLAFKFHPDQGGDEDKMKALNIAYAALIRAARTSAKNL